MSKLSDFRVDDILVPEYIPAITRDVRVLAFDQALRKTGWVITDSRAGRVSISQSGTLRTRDQEQRGNATTFAYAMEMAPQIDRIIMNVGASVDFIVHEMPPTMKLARPEASLMAGLMVRLSAARWVPQVPVLMISRQKAANLLTGNPNAKKIKMSDYLINASWIDGLAVIAAQSYREDQYDALALAITASATGE